MAASTRGCFLGAAEAVGIGGKGIENKGNRDIGVRDIGGIRILGDNGLRH